MRPPRQWRRSQIEPHRLPAQTRLWPHARAERQAAEERRNAPLRGPSAPRDAPSLGRSPRDARHPRIVGRAERTSARGRQEKARGPHRGPSDRVPHVPRRDPRRLRRRHDDDLGYGNVRADRREAERAEDTHEGKEARRRVGHRPDEAERGPRLADDQARHASEERPASFEDRADARGIGERALRLARLHVRTKVGRRPHDRVRRWGRGPSSDA